MTEPARPDRKGGLGRGLAALIPSGPEVAVSPSLPASDPEPDSTGHTPAPDPPQGTASAIYQDIPIGVITPNPRQPRQVFDEESLAELEHSIREFGLMQPIVVRQLDATSPAFELVMGERRWRAARQAGLESIPAIVRQTTDDAMLRNALLENVHRVQLNPLEEAAAYQQLLEEFDVTHDQLADRIGRSRPVITNTIRLLRLPVPVQRRVAAGVLSSGHARALLGLDDPDRQEDLASRVVAEGLSVRATEEAVTLDRTETDTRNRQASTPERMQVAGADELAERLSESLDTRVKVELGKRKGRIVVEFGSAEDLERIATLLMPADAANALPQQ